MAGIWTLACEVRSEKRRGRLVADRGEAWHRAMERIAALPDEIGQELDALGVGIFDARRVAYGFSKQEQRRRFADLKERLERRAQRGAEEKPRPVVKRGPSKRVKLRGLGVEVPRELAEAPIAVVERFVGDLLRAFVAQLGGK